MWPGKHIAGTAKIPSTSTPPFLIRKTVWLISPEDGAGTAENSSSSAIPRLSGRDSGSVPGARTPSSAGLSKKMWSMFNGSDCIKFLLGVLTASQRISSLSSWLSTDSPRPPPGSTGWFLEELWKCWRSGKTTAFKSFITAGLASPFGNGGRQLKGSARSGKKSGFEGFCC